MKSTSQCSMTTVPHQECLSSNKMRCILQWNLNSLGHDQEEFALQETPSTLISPFFLLLGSWKPYVARLARISQKKQREGKRPLCLIYRPVNKNKRTQLGRFSRQKDVFRERVLLCVCLSGSVADRRHRMWWNADQTGSSSVGHPTRMSDLQHFKEADGTSKK